MKYLSLIFSSLFLLSACQSDKPQSTKNEADTTEKPTVTKDPTTRIDNLVTAMDAVENAVNVRKNFDAGDITDRIQGTFLDSTLIKVVTNASSEYYIDSQNWYLQNGQPVYYRQFYNDRTCDENYAKHCLKETTFYIDNQKISKALQRTREIDPTKEQAAFADETPVSFSPNADSLLTALGQELDLYIKKIKE